MANEPEYVTGTFRAYDEAGEVIYEKSGWRIGKDSVPAGISIAMAASRLTGKGGKVLRKWDPRSVLSRR